MLLFSRWSCDVCSKEEDNQPSRYMPEGWQRIDNTPGWVDGKKPQYTHWSLCPACVATLLGALPPKAE